MVLASRTSVPICTPCRRLASPPPIPGWSATIWNGSRGPANDLVIYAIWIDVHGEGLPAASTVKPDRIIRSLTELLTGEAALKLLPRQGSARFSLPTENIENNPMQSSMAGSCDGRCQRLR